MARLRNFDDFLALFQAQPRRKAGNGQLVICPAHNDTEESLWVTPPKNTAFIADWTCMAGCPRQSVLDALGLTWDDVRSDSNKKKSKIIATYDYKDEERKLLYQVLRREPKDFVHRRPDSNGEWVEGPGCMKGIRRVPYQLPEVLEGMSQGKLIYIAEGERDCDNLARIGLIATTNSGGAGKWRPEYSEALRGASIIIIADKDEAGRKHAAKVANSLHGKAKSIKVLELPDRDNHQVNDVSDWLAAGGTKAELEQSINEIREWQSELPIVVCSGRHLREKTADAVQALYDANNPERIFYRGGALCRIGQDEFQRPIVEWLSEAALRGHMERSADFITYNAAGGTHVISPPLDIVRDIASLGNWRFPPLLGITEAPVIRQDGTVLNTPGYDVTTHFFYTPLPELVVPPISEYPNSAEVKKATEQLLEIICEFPFVDESSHANTVGAIMLPVIQPLVGLAPMAVFDKPQPGTGASKLADVISIIATGRPAATMRMPRSEEECEKKLNSHLLEGRRLCVIDNVDTKLWSDTLASFLTSHYISIRPLGRSADIRLKNNLIYIMTGNNVQLGGDLPRRCFWIRLDARMARPWIREGFRHPRLLEFISENRGTILAAILTIVRAWVVADKPTREKLPSLGSYEEFAKVASGILDFMGVEGFLENLMDMYELMDKDTTQWERFLEAWRDCISDTPITVKDLVERMKEEEYEDLANSLPDTLIARDKEKEERYNRRLGNALAKRVDVQHPNGLVLKKAGESHRAVTWLIQDTNSPKFIANNELGEFQPSQPSDGLKNNVYEGGVGNNSPNSPSKLKSGELTHPEIPARPTMPCHCGSTDYWLTPWKQWLCSRCHPKPEREIEK